VKYMCIIMALACGVASVWIKHPDNQVFAMIMAIAFSFTSGKLTGAQ
jgi:hypothetical protein